MKLDWETIQRARPDIWAEWPKDENRYPTFRGKRGSVIHSPQQLYQFVADILPETCSPEEIEHKILRHLTGENA